MIASTTPAEKLIDTVQLPADIEVDDFYWTVLVIDTVQLPADIWPVALQWQDRYGCWRFVEQRLDHGFELMVNLHELAYAYCVRMSEPESAMYRHRVAEVALGWKGRTVELPASARGDD